MTAPSYDATNRLARIEQLCLATKKDTGEIRWVRQFASDVLREIDPDEDWDAVAHRGKNRPSLIERETDPPCWFCICTVQGGAPYCSDCPLHDPQSRHFGPGLASEVRRAFGGAAAHREGAAAHRQEQTEGTLTCTKYRTAPSWKLPVR